MTRADEIAALAAIPAPTGAEDARLRWIEQRIAHLPGTRERDAVGNLVWRFTPDSPELLVMVHVDTVFDDATPLAIRRDGDDLVGPGVGDNAAAVLTLIWALDAMPSIPSRLAIAFTVGEEGLGNLRGAHAACAELQPAMVIALEGHGLDDIITEHVGSVRAKVTITGPGGHSWWDRATPSAIHALVKLADDLADGGANIGTISGGSTVNAIASLGEMMVERRSLNEPDLEAFVVRLGELAATPPLRLETAVLGRRRAGQIARDHPLVVSVRAAHQRLGLLGRLGSGSTDANAAVACGIPAVALGCARGSGMHTVHERIQLESLQLGRRQVTAVIRAVLD
jgi:Acetylornithine deacetylase/Succinyl-diaminopimelate desuccinylase and related deacylases